MSSVTTTPTAPARVEPRVHQVEQITTGTRQLRRRGSRALIVSACGGGKTLSAIGIAEELDARRPLVVGDVMPPGRTLLPGHHTGALVELLPAAVGGGQPPHDPRRRHRRGAGARPRRGSFDG